MSTEEAMLLAVQSRSSSLSNSTGLPSLKASLLDPPVSSKNPETKRLNAETVAGVIMRVKEGEIEGLVEGLGSEERDVLMKYVRREEGEGGGRGRTEGGRKFSLAVRSKAAKFPPLPPSLTPLPPPLSDLQAPRRSHQHLPLRLPPKMAQRARRQDRPRCDRQNHDRQEDGVTPPPRPETERGGEGGGEGRRRGEGGGGRGVLE